MNRFKPELKIVLLFCGLFPVLWMGATELLAAVGFFFGIPVSGWHVVLSLLISAVSLAVVGWKTRQFLAILLSFAGIALMLAIGWGLAGHFLDVTWDGQGYHQSAIIELAHGWDPATTYAKTGGDRLLKYANYYSKGPWICAASMFKLTGNIESGKLFNLLLMMSAFLLSLAVLLRLRWATAFAVPLALLAALNPVSVCQMFSFLVDGQLASLIVITLSLGFLFFMEEDRLINAGFFAAIVLGFNVKFNGVAYMGLIVTFFFVGAGLFHRHLLTIQRVRLVIYAGMVAVFVVGFNPYLTNTAAYRSPFHPILGPHKIDLLKLQRPTDFAGKNRFEKLYRSLFSRSDNPQLMFLQSSKPKNPFTFSKTEFRWFVQSSLRVGGFGPLFGGIFILSVLSFLGMILLYHQDRPELMLFLVGLLLSVIINPDSWWARLAPQLWLFPLALAGYLFSLKKAIARGFGIVILLTLFINIFGITWSYTTQYADVNRQLKKQLISLKHVPVILYPGLFKSVRNRLKYFHVPFREVDNLAKLPCRHPERLTWSTARFCRKEGREGPEGTKTFKYSVAN
ncbi:MAG: hypothetical protein DRJ14_02925 [Acidobacteria bacterium]|nr:MAG: hypothetical protein DRJ14_02925 [Acidobacteriota bacterium]